MPVSLDLTWQQKAETWRKNQVFQFHSARDIVKIAGREIEVLRDVLELFRIPSCERQFKFPNHDSPIYSELIAQLRLGRRGPPLWNLSQPPRPSHPALASALRTSWPLA